MKFFFTTFLALVLVSLPLDLFAIQSGGGYTVYDRISSMPGTASGGGYSSYGGTYRIIVLPTPTPTPTPTPASSGGGGGGGGGSGSTQNSSETKVILKGRAYPGASVTIFKDGTTIGTPKADTNGNWQLEHSVVGGIYTFSIYAIDKNNNRSLTVAFTTNVQTNRTTTVSDIVVAPTIGSDKSAVKSGNNIQFFGFAYPESQINIVVNSETTLFEKAQSDKTGFWRYVLNTTPLEKGDHSAKSQAVTPDTVASSFSSSIGFRVGDQDILANASPAPLISQSNQNGDLNSYKKTNIIDFSILLFFWNQKNPSNVSVDINKDGVVNVFDLSIMLYWWNG